MGNNLSFRREFGLILVGSLIFTASFLWKDLLTDIEEYYFPKKYGLGGRTIYVIIVSIILITIAISLRNIFGLSGTKGRILGFDDSPLENKSNNNDDNDNIGVDNGNDVSNPD